MSEKLLERLHPSLRAILELELARGNEVTVAGHSDSPRENEVIVCLKFPFGRRYNEFEGMRFRHVTSPIYWDDEYSVHEGRQTLACLDEEHA